MSDAHDANDTVRAALAAARTQWHLEPDDIAAAAFDQPRRKEAGYACSAVDQFIADLSTRVEGFLADVEATFASLVTAAPPPEHKAVSEHEADGVAVPTPIAETHMAGERLLRAQGLIDRLTAEAAEQARAVIADAQAHAEEIDRRAASVEEDTARRAEERFGVEAAQWTARITGLRTAYGDLRSKVEQTCYAILDDFDTAEVAVAMPALTPTPAPQASAPGPDAPPVTATGDEPDRPDQVAVIPATDDEATGDAPTGDREVDAVVEPTPSQGVPPVDPADLACEPVPDDASNDDPGGEAEEGADPIPVATVVPAPPPGDGHSLMQILGMDDQAADETGPVGPEEANWSAVHERARG